MNKQKKIIAFWFPAILLAGLVLQACNNEVNYIDELKDIADQVNSKCPAMLDSETRIDGIEIAAPNTIIYKQTLVHVEAGNVDTPAFKRALRSGLISNTKISSQMKKLRDNQTTLHYAYRDKSNKHICVIKITPKDYN